MIAIVAAVSVAGQAVHLNAIRAEPWADTVWAMARFFTIVTAVLVAGTWVLAGARRDGVPAAWLAALTLSMVMVGAVYHALLAGLVSFTGLGWWADHGLHTVLPLLCMGWWLVHAPKRSLDYGDLPVFLLWPAIYAAYVMARGALDGAYPYPFVDLQILSPAAVLTNLAGLLILFALGGVMMILVGRFADR